MRDASLAMPMRSRSSRSSVSSRSSALASCKGQLDARAARKTLASMDPIERDKGASALQKAYAKDPRSLGDHGEVYWAERLKQLPGASSSVAAELLAGGQSMGGEGGGGASTDHYRLDDFWSADLYRDRTSAITGYAPLRRDVVHVDVTRPEHYTGTWKTYFVNGAVFDACEYEGGVPRRDRELHDNGQLRREYVYVDGNRHGTVLTYFANGKTEWEQSFSNGKQVGVETWFYPNGKPRQEDHWADDKRDGRTTYWNEDGSRDRCIDYRAGVEVGRGCYGN